MIFFTSVFIIADLCMIYVHVSYLGEGVPWQIVVTENKRAEREETGETLQVPNLQQYYINSTWNGS